MFRPWISVFAPVLIVLLLAQGCNTVRGAGKDIEQGGKAIQRSSGK